MTSWSRRFQDPITMPDGSTIRTIGEAAEYATSLPRKIGNTEPWQRAAKVLHEAAEHGGPFVFMARINFYRAVYGDTTPPIGNSGGKKSRNWVKRKLARDR
jgi:hypothetical protein